MRANIKKITTILNALHKAELKYNRNKVINS
jgi:hypothetical protein